MKTLIRRSESPTLHEHALGIQIGSVCCELRCQDTEIYDKLQKVYHNYLTDEEADVTAVIELTDRMSVDKLRSVLERTRYIHKGNRFRTTSKLINGDYYPESRTIKITGERNLLDPDVEINNLNQLISAAYYSACKTKYDMNPPAMLVHACGILRHDRVLVFTGPSEIGKTTVAQLCGEKHGEVFNDEMLLMSRPGPNGNGVTIQNAPILGDLLPGRNTAAPLSCIFLLKQNNRTSLRYLDKAEAYLRFIRQIIAPTCIGYLDKRTVYSLMADFSAEIVKAVPIYELEFNRDANALWQIANELEGIPGGGPLK